MKRYDFGTYGDVSSGAGFYCFITDVLVDGKLVIMADDGGRSIIEEKDFKPIGTLDDYVHSIYHYKEECIVNGKSVTCNKIFFETVFSAKNEVNSVLSGYYELLLEVVEKNSDTIAAFVVFHPSPDHLTTYVTLTELNVPTNGIQFTLGHTYQIYRGCLLDENGACYADQIHSVDELNLWEEGDAHWVETESYDEIFEADNP